MALMAASAAVGTWFVLTGWLPEASAPAEATRAGEPASKLATQGGTEREAAERESPASPNEDAAREPPSGAAYHVTYLDGRLSLEVESRPLVWVLDEISEKTEIAFVTDVEIEDEMISLQFIDLPLDEGLRRLLAGKDSFFYYDDDVFPRVVWIYPPGQGRGLEPVPPQTWASTRELEEMMDAPDAETRARTVSALTERLGQEALDTVLDALQDEDGMVRAEALYAAANEDLELPADLLMKLLREDPSKDVRFLALRALSEDAGAAAAAEYALDDADPIVRAEAEEILDETEAANSPGEPAASPPQGQQ